MILWKNHHVGSDTHMLFPAFLKAVSETYDVESGTTDLEISKPLFKTWSVKKASYNRRRSIRPWQDGPEPQDGVASDPGSEIEDLVAGRC